MMFGASRFEKSSAVRILDRFNRKLDLQKNHKLGNLFPAKCFVDIHIYMSSTYYKIFVRNLKPFRFGEVSKTPVLGEISRFGTFYRNIQ